jgi:hypothetical protein
MVHCGPPEDAMVGEMVVGERLGPRILHGLAEVIYRTRQILNLLAHQGGQQYAHTLLPAPTWYTRTDNRVLYFNTDSTVQYLQLKKSVFSYIRKCSPLPKSVCRTERGFEGECGQT